MGDAPKVDDSESSGPVVDKKALDRLVVKLKKTLERPDQAELELDHNGYLSLSALGGKFRIEKLKPILGLDKSEMDSATVYSKLKKAISKTSVKVFEWKAPDPNHVGEVLAVRLHGYAPQVTGPNEEPYLMFPGAVPHTLRGLLEKGGPRLKDLFRTHLKPGVPVIFVEPKSIVEYRGVSNDHVINFLDNARSTGAYQIAILSWAGIKSGPSVRLDKVQARATYMLDQMGLQDVPSFTCCGHRIGLVALAKLAADALETSAVVLNKGREMAESTFGDTGAMLLEEIGFETPVNIPLWLYASQSTRSTSSTGSNSSHDGDYGETPEAAALFACNMWRSVCNTLNGNVDTMRTQSAVIVDTNGAAEATQTLQVPTKSLEAMMKPHESVPREVFSELARQVSAQADITLASLREQCAKTDVKITPGGLLAGAILRSGVENFQPLFTKYADIFIEIVEENPSEQIRVLLAVSEAATDKKVHSSLLKIFKLLYDLDITPDEDAYFAWEKRVVSRGNAKQIMAKVKPFFEWLREADEESE